MEGKDEKSFYFRDGQLFCEDMSVETILEKIESQKRLEKVDIGYKKIEMAVPTTPCYIYSQRGIKNNVKKYLDGMKKYNLRGILGYAIKANENIHILTELKSLGVDMLVTVSGFEILAALQANFEPYEIIFNGNGKQEWEIMLAIEQGVFLNVDSLFDAQTIARIASFHYPESEVKVLLRIRPGVKPGVHPYIDTSGDSKFGFDCDDLSIVLEELQVNEKIKIYGVQCHLGSCIKETKVFSDLAKFVEEAYNILLKKNISVNLFDIGGGIAIDYHKDIPGAEGIIFNEEIPHNSPGTIVPTISQFLEKIAPFIPPKTQVLFEPGRSLIGDAGMIIAKVLGTKATLNGLEYMIVDASMNELIRPCLYKAYHKIYPVKMNFESQWKKFEVVGPICETSDFLGKSIVLQYPTEYVAIMDAGAYAASMSSNYNLRPKPSEYFVRGNELISIRQRDTYSQMTGYFGNQS